MSGFWGRATCSVLYGAIVITQQFKGPASLYRTWRQPLRGSKAVLIYQAPYSPTMPVRRSERHFGAKFALLRSFLIAIRFFAPPLQTATAAPGCGLVFAVHLETASLFELARVFWTLSFGKSKIPSLISCLVIIIFYLTWSSVAKLLMRSAVIEKINVLSNRIP